MEIICFKENIETKMHTLESMVEVNDVRLDGAVKENAEMKIQTNQLRSETDKSMLSLLDMTRQMASNCPGHSGPQSQQTAMLGNSVQYIPGMANQSWPQFQPITENIATQNLEENN